MPFTIAIIGRPNVGKSSLFNKLVGRKIAIVNDFAGVTRDRKIENGSLFDMDFEVIDTAGLEYDLKGKELETKMVKQTEQAIFNADLSLFVVDGREGITQTDRYFATWLRKKEIPSILIANKMEFLKEAPVFDDDFYRLGMGDPIPISAEHNDGFNLLYDAIREHYKETPKEEVRDNEISIAIIGRPNAGKSTLINSILKDDRVITSDVAGTTRDAISIRWKYKDRNIKLIDTAGIRKKHNVEGDLEKFAVDDAIRAIRFAQIVIVMIDSTRPFDTQDLAIADIAVEEGRGVIFALNKWDTVPPDAKHKFMNSAIEIIRNRASQVKGCPIIPISALYSKNIDKLIDSCLLVWNEWDKHLKTTELNKWLKNITTEHTPPLFKGRAVKLKYMTQAKTRPPTFVLFTNSPEKLEKTSYDKFLINRIRTDLGLQNTIVRLLMRKIENPFDGKKK
ncbi:MAG: ribosome biogenesis GTPase Der [Rickettsiales bacterium]|jgi:GTP-binding protein|nr:ribosome biogenesis GTPase Der [Rickettsiales bacterium]